MQQEPPFSEKMLDRSGELTPRWRLWLMSLKTLDDQISIQKQETYTSSRQLTTSDFGKVIRFNNGSQNVTCTLPSANLADIGGSMTIYKLGTGNLRIYGHGSDVIGNSSAGKGIVSAEPTRKENVIVMVESANRWSITGGIGIWYVV